MEGITFRSLEYFRLHIAYNDMNALLKLQYDRTIIGEVNQETTLQGFDLFQELGKGYDASLFCSPTSSSQDHIDT